MRTTTRQSKKITVHVFVQDDVSDMELKATQSLIDTLCGFVSEECDRTNTLPLVLIPLEKGGIMTCEGGWELEYSFKKLFQAQTFALYVSLVGPVCGVMLSNRGQESSVHNRWVERLRPQGFQFRGEESDNQLASVFGELQMPWQG